MEPSETVLSRTTDLTGTRISHYKLLQKIGEGGFGEVYMAEQQEPVSRKVALKVIKPGMDSREVIARFESERQALAMMEHPNIAQVLDAGTTSNGQPYFVMELVRGVPITEFCDRNRMSPVDRLRLFVTVCQAVQHAHYKGIIHRDIKPSNVMVTLHDGIPVVKVIDFGVAKATAQKLTDKTLFTAWGQMIGTPAYMSPEQAEMSGLDIDTRSDVYSLGVLLYELLTGSTPLDVQRLKEAGFVQMQKMIQEHEPVRPSLRISSLGQNATILAGNRSTDIKRWLQSLQGDLDWIVMKTLEKDRNRRYATPNSLAADIDRFLNGEAIEARPPSLGYRLYRGYRRNRAAVLAGCSFAVLLSAATILSLSFAMKAMRSEAVAELRRQEAESSRKKLQDTLQVAEQARSQAELMTARVITSDISLDFSEYSVLRLAEQLPQISDTQKDYKDFAKLNIYGALQYLATTSDSPGYGFASDYGSSAKIHPVKASGFNVSQLSEGYLAYSESRNAMGLRVVHLPTQTVVINAHQVFNSGVAITSVNLTPTVVCVTGDDSHLSVFSLQTGEKLWERKLPWVLSNGPETSESVVDWSSLLSDDSSSETDGDAPEEAIATFEDLQANTILVTRHTDLNDQKAVTFVIIDAETGDQQEIQSQHLGQTLVRFSRDGQRIAAADDQGLVSVRDVRSGTVICELKLTDGVPSDLCFHPDHQTIAVALNSKEGTPSASIRILSPRNQYAADSRILSTPYHIASGQLRFLDAALLTTDVRTYVTPENSGTTWICDAGFETDAFLRGDAVVRVCQMVVLMANQNHLLVDDEVAFSVLRRSDLSVVPAKPEERFPEELKEFAINGRYLAYSASMSDRTLDYTNLESGSSMLVDLKTGINFPGNNWNTIHSDSVSGYAYCGNPGYFMLLVPPRLDHLDDSQMLLLSQLVACGEFNKERQFVFWSRDVFRSRLQKAIESNSLNVGSIPFFEAYLTHPAYWEACNIRHLNSQLENPGPRSIGERPQIIANLQAAWNALISRDPSAESHFAYLNCWPSIAASGPEEILRLHLKTVEMFPNRYWTGADISFPTSDQFQNGVWTNDRNTDIQQLICRWYDARSSYHNETLPVEFNYIDCATEAWCLEHTGQLQEALQVIKTGLSRQASEQSSDSNADGADAQSTLGETVTVQQETVSQQEGGDVSNEEVLLNAHLFLLAKALNDQQQSAAAFESLCKLLNVPVDDKKRLVEAISQIEHFAQIRELLAARITHELQ